MLGVGIDCAEQFHLVALGRPENGVFEVTRVEHTPVAVTALMTRIAGWNRTRQRWVVIGTSHGVQVEQVPDAG